jgi:hypothetical protein
MLYLLVISILSLEVALPDFIKNIFGVSLIFWTVIGLLLLLRKAVK